jgi:hypothetical protein
MADQAQTLRPKDLPRRVETLPVIKGIFLGWLSDLRQEGGYFAYVLTYGVTDVDKGNQYQGHLMWAAGLDKPWRRIESRLELERHEAKAAFADHEKLAEWPEGN